MWPSEGLLSSGRHIWNITTEFPNKYDEVDPDVSYRRAISIAEVYELSLHDIMVCSSKFWDMHTDPILCMDGAATTLLTIQYNLCTGTLASFLPERPDLASTISSLLKYETIGQFCLTELGHGLDAFNLGTTATLLADGSFELNTPCISNSKFMPPTIPALGRPCIAIVFARLMVDDEFRGLRPFLVNINDGINMHAGVTAKLLPARHGSSPVNHAITMFNRVQLPGTALLGKLSPSTSAHADFLQSIWRVGVGTLALSSIALPALRISTVIAYRYSLRRTVRDAHGKPQPIISFRTQQVPIYVALAQTYVLDALHKRAVKHFADNTSDHRVRHGVATVLKSVMMQHSQSSHMVLSERCGAQGLFAYNQIISMTSEIRGIGIAEGDTLVLSIRLATELILGRYALPAPQHPKSLLALHEEGIFAECRAVVTSYGHRGEEFASLVLHRCESCVQAMGHRMAYDAAIAENVPQVLIDLYVSQAVKSDLAWYVEAGLISRFGLLEMERIALDAVGTHASKWVDDMGMEVYIHAPIICDCRWDSFLQSLPSFPDTAPLSPV
ncbi:hypothetical protein PUNSTDRAFT_64010 [Punctularia strigosozonata HHB-11173 SS5]|uniref:uncharacterized protein n=1 Tax=Punctularia strigosozonata (strain HHB-11173) TaxID=741275 RepID=UPI0004416607|nr:uncharacterized protein PUNSTDRAFT_64010 [Punctularia strigosozonata HHB-11173 SS5]EIN11086.1 hypothetical protein PUNSTDRAFT_64010 [Punctularia strigosozonata HHB-11173 SS5]